MKRQPNEVSPRQVLAEVAAAIPIEVHPNIIIIGSLAAAYWIFRKDESFGVRTKDVDCVLSPYVAAVDKGRAVAEALLTARWTPQERRCLRKARKRRDPGRPATGRPSVSAGTS